ncbi:MULTISPECIES: PASTA domain-containing protein [Dysgonomonas]|uniref:PASTA domain-containing protein n=1 Tax=Dysgonomonas TaxID=156973 RepID=UPI00092812FD|nr:MULTISPECIES: PASTA domain-containing protein [Dysgonomonas]MBN9301260.1 PASTA domain-containing protein [Dysgonomonas mossii]OJX60087.1 MAG: PASTA domain-containing protein [Dysgonomonas sp. 37-18]
MKKENIIFRLLKNIYVKNVLMMIGAFVGLVIIVLFLLNFYTKHNESITVPTVKGLQVQDAAGILESSDLRYEISDSIFQAEGAPGSIIEQIPKEQSKVKKGRTVFLVIKAKGVQLVSVPELKDYSRRQAEAQLASLGFNKITIQEVPAAYKGLVISISYRGKQLTPNQKIPKGSPLVMTVGAGGDVSEGDSISEQSDSQDIEKSFFE